MNKKLFRLKLKYWNWKYKKFTKCDFCGKSLFRYESHGGVDLDVNISGSKKETAYLCLLCYHLFNK